MFELENLFERKFWWLLTLHNEVIAKRRKKYCMAYCFLLRPEFSWLWFTVLQKCGHAVIQRFIHPKGCQLVLKTDHVLERCLRCESCGLFTLKVVVNGETETIIMGSNLLKMSISLPVPLWVQELYLTQMIHQLYQKPRILISKAIFCTKEKHF